MLVGDPVPDSPDFGSLANMMRIYTGVTTRSTDITPNNTYRAIKIESVNLLKFLSFFKELFF
jgi:hypothetical protein